MRKKNTDDDDDNRLWQNTWKMRESVPDKVHVLYAVRFLVFGIGSNAYVVCLYFHTEKSVRMVWNRQVSIDVCTMPMSNRQTLIRNLISFILRVICFDKFNTSNIANFSCSHDRRLSLWFSLKILFIYLHWNLVHSTTVMMTNFRDPSQSIKTFNSNSRLNSSNEMCLYVVVFFFIYFPVCTRFLYLILGANLLVSLFFFAQQTRT